MDETMDMESAQPAEFDDAATTSMVTTMGSGSTSQPTVHRTFTETHA